MQAEMMFCGKSGVWGRFNGKHGRHGKGGGCKGYYRGAAQPRRSSCILLNRDCWTACSASVPVAMSLNRLG
jgi:hypothetical protein